MTTTLVEVIFGAEKDTTVFFVNNIVRLRIERAGDSVALIDAGPLERLLPAQPDFPLVESFEDRRLLLAKALEVIAQGIRDGRVEV